MESFALSLCLINLLISVSLVKYKNISGKFIHSNNYSLYLFFSFFRYLRTWSHVCSNSNSEHFSYRSFTSFTKIQNTYAHCKLRNWTLGKNVPCMQTDQWKKQFVVVQVIQKTTSAQTNFVTTLTFSQSLKMINNNFDNEVICSTKCYNTV